MQKQFAVCLFLIHTYDLMHSDSFGSYMRMASIPTHTHSFPVISMEETHGPASG